jgi:hypothetical protein
MNNLPSATYNSLSLSSSLGLDLLSQRDIVADLVHLRVPLTYSDGSPHVTVGNYLTATDCTVTATKNSNQLRIVGAQPFAQATHMGHPITVTLAGLTWSGILRKVVNSGGDQLLGIVEKLCPATVVAQAGTIVDVGLTLSSADAGKIWYAQGAVPRQTSFVAGTIQEVTARNAFALTSDLRTGHNSSGDIMETAIGTDNYPGLKAASVAALQAGHAVILNGNLMSSAIPQELTQVRRTGTGRVFWMPGHGAFSNFGKTDQSPPSYLRCFFIPPQAPPPPGASPRACWNRLFLSDRRRNERQRRDRRSVYHRDQSRRHRQRVLCRHVDRHAAGAEFRTQEPEYPTLPCGWPDDRQLRGHGRAGWHWDRLESKRSDSVGRRPGYTRLRL